MSAVYLVSLVAAIIGTGLLDWRHKLAVFGSRAPHTLIIVGIAVAFFLIWDLVGIAEGVFFRGSGPWMTGVLLAPELPLEEVFFLILLSYSTLIAYLLAGHYLKGRTR
jgi:lycopene cyclase domain-containing protein